MDGSDTAAFEAFLKSHAPLAPKTAFAEGDTMDAWRVTAFLGKGSGGEVYRVVREGDAQVAAVKVHVPRPGKSEAQLKCARERFQRETQILAENRYPFFPRFYGEGEARGYPYFAMELLEPVTLPSKDRDIADFLLHAAIAVRTLHRYGLVHRDIKPQNIMRRANGEWVLIDLGLVKSVATGPSPSSSPVTIVDGRAVGAGTPRYAAPEQFNGGEISFATDIHALGMMANECFGGNPPRIWERIISRATSSIPARRYADANALIRAIRRRHWGRCAGVGGLLIACLALGAWALVGSRVPTRPPSSARTPLTETIIWKNLTEHVVTNVVSKELVYEKFGTNVWGRTERTAWAYRNVTNRVAGTVIRLKGQKHVFGEPLVLNPGEHYWIVGPGTLDAAVEGVAGREEVGVHLADCTVINRTRVPVRDNGIRYYFDGGVYLNFIEQESPGSNWLSHMEDFDGAYNAIEFGGPETLKELLRRRGY